MLVKDKRIVLRIFILIAVILTMLSYHFIRRGNIMDEIYRAIKKNDFKVINIVPELKDINYEDLSQLENFGGLSIPYKEEYLKDSFKSELFFPVKDDKIQILSNVRLDSATLLIIYMSYDYKNKIMNMEPIHISYREEDQELGEHYYDSQTITEFLNRFDLEEKDIKEYQDYFLYDIVVKTWAKAHGENVEKAVQKMKECKRIDKTFTFEN